MIKLCLYVTRGTSSSVRALENLRVLCADELSEMPEIEVVDVVEDPKRAESANILATPTLICTSTNPELRVIGDLSDRSRVKAILLPKGSLK